jgi:hypothetical protein
MTKSRAPYSFEDAALQILHNLGVDFAAQIVDRGPSALRKWSDPDSDGRPTLHQAVKLDSAHLVRHGSAPFLDAYRKQLESLVEGAPRAVEDLAVEVLDVPDAVGQLVRLVRRARAATSEGGAGLSANERAQLLKAIAETREELSHVEAAVVSGAIVNAAAAKRE